MTFQMGSQDRQIAQADPTGKTYHLECFVVPKRVAYKDVQSHGPQNQTSYMVFLVPDQSTQSDRFWAAWMPADMKEHFEVATIIGSPVRSQVRCSVHSHSYDLNLGRPTNLLPRPHLFVMSEDAEIKLLTWVQGLQQRHPRTWQKEARIKVRVLPAEEEDVLG